MRLPAITLICAGLTAIAASAFGALPAAKKAPEPSGGIDFGHAETPLEVTSDQGIEFSQDSKEVIARVNAKATRGNATVTADTLTAYYRDKSKAEGQAAPPPKPVAEKPKDETATASEIWRVVADGTVEIFNPTQHAYGDHADYNLDDAVVVLTGDHLKMTTPLDVVTAKDSLEYWEQRHEAVARGNAVAIRGEKRIQADVLVAEFAENAEKQMVVKIAHGYDHVVLTTTTDVVTGDRADYAVETGIVTVTGSVKMTRENNQLNGGYAVVNLNTGISKLYPAPPGAEASESRVKGLLVPQKKAPPSPPAPAKGP